MERKTLETNGTELFYRTVGTGPAVVLIHGFGEDGEVWKRQWEALGADFQLIIPDLPGTGASGAIADTSMEGMADAINALLEALQPGKTVLIGHSMGGYIALAFAEKYSYQLTGLGLFHSSAYADTDEKKATRKKGIAFIEQNGPLEFLKTATPKLFSPVTKEKAPHLIEEQLEASRNLRGESLIAYYEAMMKRPDRTHVLREVKVPVLFLLGRHDTAVPLKDGLEQAPLPEQSSLHILENSGHMGMSEETEAANNILRDFIRLCNSH